MIERGEKIRVCCLHVEQVSRNCLFNSIPLGLVMRRPLKVIGGHGVKFKDCYTGNEMPYAGPILTRLIETGLTFDAWVLGAVYTIVHRWALRKSTSGEVKATSSDTMSVLE